LYGLRFSQCISNFEYTTNYGKKRLISWYLCWTG